MRTASAVGANTAAGLTKAFLPHADDVVEVRAGAGYRLWARFADETSGTIELEGLILSEHAGIFAALQDQALFSAVYVESGAITWPNGADLAPDALYAALRERGCWSLA